MTARPIFIGGTSSNAGKSWMATALCAWLRGRGVRVAPFKAQNMSNNSYPCKGGGEIGRAQAAQADACGLDPEPAMKIHLGLTTSDGTVAPFARLADGGCDGVRGNRVIGTYLHGALENPAVCAEIFGVPIDPPEPATRAHRRLAEWFETHARSIAVLGL